jgi:hypothetical protein
MASRIVARYASDVPKTSSAADAVAAIAARYVGMRRSTNQRYIGVVKAAYAMLVQGAPP